MFHASVAFLPSTFAMYTTMLGTAAFMDRGGAFRTARGVFWFAFGGLLGWPFSMAMCVPFVLEELIMGLTSFAAPRFLIEGGMIFLGVLVSCVPESSGWSNYLLFAP